jgi:hypothetical protein
LRVVAIALLIASMLCPALSAEKGTGTVCVIPNSTMPPRLISPGGSYNPKTLQLKIDKREAVLWPHKDTLKIEDLDLKERHLIVLLSDGKRIQSFRFRFADFGAARLCMSFDGYQGVQLQVGGTTYCKCK